MFRDQLEISIGSRIAATVKHGREVKHGERQGGEQALVGAINKLLADR